MQSRADCGTELNQGGSCSANLTDVILRAVHREMMSRLPTDRSGTCKPVSRAAATQREQKRSVRAPEELHRTFEVDRDRNVAFATILTSADGKEDGSPPVVSRGLLGRHSLTHTLGRAKIGLRSIEVRSRARVDKRAHLADVGQIWPRVGTTSWPTSTEVEPNSAHLG